DDRLRALPPRSDGVGRDRAGGAPGPATRGDPYVAVLAGDPGPGRGPAERGRTAHARGRRWRGPLAGGRAGPVGGAGALLRRSRLVPLVRARRRSLPALDAHRRAEGAGGPSRRSGGDATLMRLALGAWRLRRLSASGGRSACCVGVSRFGGATRVARGRRRGGGRV